MARAGLDKHRKFLRLARVLDAVATGMGELLARGALETLWDAAYERADDYLGDADDVEIAAKWRGARGVLFEALLNAGGPHTPGFIEPDERGGYRVHDLWEHAPPWVKRKAGLAQARAAAGKTISDIRREAGKRSQGLGGSGPILPGQDAKKAWAQALVKRAIEDGQLARGACVTCGDASTDAHHEDYDRPLDVTWLCRKHHLKAHCGSNRAATEQQPDSLLLRNAEQVSSKSATRDGTGRDGRGKGTGEKSIAASPKGEPPPESQGAEQADLAAPTRQAYLDAIAAASSGRFVASKPTKGGTFTLDRARKRPNALDEASRIGQWLAAGGDGWRQGKLDGRDIGPSLDAWNAQSAAWESAGGGPVGRLQKGHVPDTRRSRITGPAEPDDFTGIPSGTDLLAGFKG